MPLGERIVVSLNHSKVDTLIDKFFDGLLNQLDSVAKKYPSLTVPDCSI
jgi:hypothetical protein